MSEIQIRNTRYDDLSQIIEIERQSFPESVQANQKIIVKRFNAFPQGNFVIVCDKEIVGFSSSILIKKEDIESDCKIEAELHKDDGAILFVLDLAIIPHFQNIDLGKKLAFQNIEFARENRKQLIFFYALENTEDFYKKLPNCTRAGNYQNISGTMMALWKINISVLDN